MSGQWPPQTKWAVEANFARFFYGLHQSFGFELEISGFADACDLSLEAIELTQGVLNT